MQHKIHARNHDNRSGITLLFVVSMIVLFLLMGTTFVVVSNDYLTAARKRGRFQQHGDAGPVLIQRAFYDLIRGPDLRNTMSPLRGLSILADQYGYGFRGYVDSINVVNGSNAQLFDLQLKDSQNTLGNLEPILINNGAATLPISTITNDVEHFFTGQVMSFVSGPAKGTSVRIFSYKVQGTAHVFRVYSDGSESSGIELIQAALPNNPTRVVINGREFSGFGAGYNRNHDPNSGGNPITDEAFRPNWRSLQDFNDTDPNWNNFADAFANFNSSVNEPYDTFGHNDMHLAGVGDIDGDPGTNDAPIASFHRPRLASIPANANVPEGRYSFRPVYTDVDGDGFPDAGSTANVRFPNVTTPFVNRPLDVDNDGDGIADSIWMDFGFSFHSNAEGRRVKPLVSVMIQDLDGRLNVNAHGNQVDADPTRNQMMTRWPMLGNGMGPKGFGFGPVEVSLRDLYPSSAGNYQRLLTGFGTPFEGRYGADGVPGSPGRENWSYVKFAGYPDAQSNPTWNLNSPNSTNGFVGGLFTSEPVDLFGRYSYGFLQQIESVFNTPYGIQAADVAANTRPDVANPVPDIFDSPYEVNLLESTLDSNDNLFAATELERVLRPAERDTVSLPDRLYALLGDDAQAARNIVTTHSFEIPRTPQVLDTVLREEPPGSGMFVPRYQWLTLPELLYRRLIENGRLPDDARADLAVMLAPEVLRGMPMDVNRLFGDGLDSDGDFVFDEHFKDDPANPNAAINEARADLVYDLANGTTVLRDADNDGVTGVNPDPVTMDPENDYLSRQIFARHLYMLVWLAAGQGTSPPDMNIDGMRNTADIDALAQWCVNVVDFRDADAINTVFEYDRNPFDGWGVNGELNPAALPIDTAPANDIGVVWGAERAELLLSEVIGLHDRKSEDLPNGGGMVGSGDSDYDSDAVPVASSFVELYAPNYVRPSTNGLPNSEKPHAELYTSGAIDLTRSASSSDVVPIWRMAFTKEQGQDPMGTSGRRVYFIRPSNTVSQGFPAEDGVNENYYYPDSTIVVNPIQPNGYAVVGSGGIRDGIGYRTTFGRRTDAFLDHTGMHAATDLMIDATRRINLIPGVGVEIHGADSDSANREQRQCVAIPLTRSGHVSLPGFMTDGDGAIRSFGLSDPQVGYVDHPNLQAAYPGITAAPMAPGGNVADGDCYVLSQIVDQPVDVITDHDFYLYDDGTHGDYSWVALQRLANPQAPYDPLENPYITVDEKPIDLIVFNGSEPGDEPGLPPAPDDEKMEFKTVERGETDDRPITGGGPAAWQRRLLWKPEWSSEPPVNDNPGMVVIDHIFDEEFFESLGQMNATYRDPVQYADFTNTAWPALSWNNRPFVSHFELALVPGGSGQKLYGPHRPGVQRAGANVPYLSTFEVLQNFSMPGATFDPVTSSCHLLKFRKTDNTMAKIFDFLEVPSRFLGTDMDFNAGDFRGWDSSEALAGINAPYHTVSRRRNPGKININTVLSEKVWNGLIGDFATMGTTPMTYAQLVASRRGSGAVSDFDNPFRPSDYGALAPSGVTRFTNPVDQYEATFLRGRNGTAGSPRMFDYENVAASFNDTRRSEVFAESAMGRIGNIATTRSSVYAIWITVGYFEVDNYGLLGAEVGADENKAVRHRGFYIYDRSIPVAFEPGNNHNVERGILVESYFE